MKLPVLLAAIALGSGACRRPEEPRRAPADLGAPKSELVRQSEAGETPHGSMHMPGRAVIGLYHPSPTERSLAELLPRHLQGSPIQPAKDLAAAEALRARGQAAAFAVERSLAELPVQSREDLAYFGRGLTDADLTRLAKPASVTYLEIVSPQATTYASAQAGEQLVAALAKEAGAYVFDALTNETFNVEAWRAQRLAAWKDGVPFAMGHVAVRIRTEPGRSHALSLGMLKLGLPAVSVRDVDEMRLERLDELMRIILQALIEQGALDDQGTLSIRRGSDSVPLAFTWTKPEPGDREPLELTLALGEGAARQQRYAELMRRLGFDTFENRRPVSR